MALVVVMSCAAQPMSSNAYSVMSQPMGSRPWPTRDTTVGSVPAPGPRPYGARTGFRSPRRLVSGER
jgi:hypothetical protein